MRTFFQHSAATIIVLLFPITLLLALPLLNGFTPTKLKVELQRQGTYTQLSQEAKTRIGSLVSGGDSLLGSSLSTQIQQELTPAYVQTKVEGVIDQTADWTTGKSTKAPELSFNDLKAQILAQNPAAQTQFTALQQSAAQLQQTAQSNDLPPQLTNDPQLQQVLTQLSQQGTTLQSVAQGDYRISLQQPLAALPTLYHTYRTGVPILVGLLGLLVLFGAALGRSWPDRLGWLGWTMLITGLWNGLSAIIFHLTRTAALERIEGVLATTPLSPILKSIVAVLLDQFRTIELFASLLLIGFGVICYLAARFMRRTPPPRLTATPLTSHDITTTVTTPSSSSFNESRTPIPLVPEDSTPQVEPAPRS